MKQSARGSEQGQGEWTVQRERGSAFTVRFIFWVARKLGRTVTRCLLYPITFYFFATSGKARRASRDFLSRALQRPVSLLDVIRHYNAFSAVILDRVYFLTGEYDRFDISMSRGDLVRDYLKAGRGFIFLGSHLGTFEVLRVLAMDQEHIPLKIVMKKGQNPVLTAMLNNLNPEIAANVLDPEDPSTLFAIKEFLDRGYVVGMLGDRNTANTRRIECDFLGGRASFPAAPTILASLCRVPVILFFGLYRGGNRYDTYFELLVEGKQIQRHQRDEQVAYWTQRYADRLAHYARMAPFNWFNFYDFWGR